MAMAPPRVPEPGARPESGDADALLFALIRDIRADVQDFERSLARLEAACEASRIAGDNKALDEALADETPAVSRLQSKIEDGLARVRSDAFAGNPDLWSACGDEVTSIDNLWNRVIADWPPAGSDREDVAERVARVRGYVREILVHTARLTVADRLAAHLRTVRIGKAISFDAAFADEIPDDSDRQAILTYLADHPGAVRAVIDTPRRLVFRVAGDLRVRVATYLAPLVAAAAGAGVVAIGGKVDDWLDLSDWPAGMRNASALLTGYFFVLIGAVVHVGVEALKQERFGAGTSFLALDDLLNWLHIRYLSICASVLWVLVGIFGLAATTSHIRWGTAFLVGYSLDSLGGLFLQRFGQAVERKTSALTKAAGPEREAAMGQR